MKKIIDGKSYDTGTARPIGTQEYPGNIGSVTEALYFTKSGRYFLHISGRSPGVYQRRKGNEEIVPLTLDEAKVWSLNYMAPIDYQDWFGPAKPEHPEDRGRFTTNLSRSCKVKLRQIKEATGKTYSDIIEMLVDTYEMGGA